jgi:AcrR family transcriptional regulator
MPRSGEQARARLQQAALDLYREYGYDSTTTAQIAERAGVTERTFFRHFADKREVLFDGEAVLRADLERGIADAADGLDPLAVLHSAIRTVLPLLRRNRSFAEPRQRVIAQTPALSERALTKEATLIRACGDALQHRGVSARQASIASQIAWAAFSRATFDWFADPSRELEDYLEQAFDDVRALTVEHPRSASTTSGRRRAV